MMVPDNSENSVPKKEQFGNENDAENTKNSNEVEKTESTIPEDPVNEETTPVSEQEPEKEEKKVEDHAEEIKEEAVEATSEPTSEESKEQVEESVEQASSTTSEATDKVENETPKTDEDNELNEAPAKVKKAYVDFSKLTKEELLVQLKQINNSTNVHDIKSDADNIKNFFYKKHKADVERVKAKFIEDGGVEEDFTPESDPLEKEFKEELNKHQQLKADYNRKLDELKTNNLKVKYGIIEEIEGLINNQESINKTFHDFRDLQKKWRDAGIVPQSELKDLWEKYNYAVEKFYDFIKINKELRDLDFKKNSDNKIVLCEKAEALLLESNVVNAFKQLQHYHDQWREIGPVPKENRTELWERFKEATSKINKKHHEFFETLKKEQKGNLEKKTVLCEKAEEIAGGVYESQKDWEQKSKELIELQSVWKTIGFAPKKYNNVIYQRFREACDKFFNAKRDYYSQNKEEQINNLQLKTDLCVQAESLKDSTDWKNTTDELIKLQKRWKEIGPVPRKNSDEVWHRFRAACDHFFDSKSHYYNNIDSEFEDNLKKKEEIIEQIKAFVPVENVQENLRTLNEFQREWTEIGFVPFKEKERIQEVYREALNSHYDNLDIDEERKKLIKFKSRLDNIAAKPRPLMKLRQEREKFATKLKQLESDIALWENNIGFFAKSNNASEMIHDFEEKIETGRERLAILDEKVKLIDDIIDQLNSK